MAHSLLDNEITITSAEATNSTDTLPDLSETHQINLLAHNFDNLNVSNSPSDKYLSFLLPVHSRDQISKIPGCHKCLTDDGCKDSNCVFCVRGFCHLGPCCKNYYSHFVMCGNGINYCKDEILRLRNSNNNGGYERHPSKHMKTRYLKTNHNRTPSLRVERRKKRLSYVNQSLGINTTKINRFIDNYITENFSRNVSYDPLNLWRSAVKDR